MDEPLLTAVSRGDEQAFTALFDKYAQSVHGFLLEHLHDETAADDLVQEIFTKIWLLRDTLPGVKKFRGFLFVMSRNYALNHIKARVREHARIQKWYRHQVSPQTELESDPTEAFDDLVDQAIESLPQQQKKAWILSRKEKKKYNEIAEEMNLSRETVKKYIQYANEQLKRTIEVRVNFPLIIFLPFFY